MFWNNKKDKPEIASFTQRRTEKVKFNTSFVKFANLYVVRTTWMKYLIAACAGLFMSIITVFLVEVTGLYTGGTTAFFQGLSRFFFSLISVYCPDIPYQTKALIYNLMFWGFYLVVNIPLLIFAYFKLNKRFALLSATYLICMQVFGFLWTLIPGIHNVMLFGNTATVDENLKNFNIQVITFSPNIFPFLDETHHNFNWGTICIADNIRSSELVMSSITSQNATEFFLLIVYAIVFSFFSATFGSIMYMISGSTAGGDIITIYFSQEKHKNLGTIMIIYNTTMMVLGIIFGSYLSGVVFGNSYQFHQIINLSNQFFGRQGIDGCGITSNPYVGWQYLVSGNLVASFIWVMFHGMLIDKLFPWHKMVRVEIFTSPESVSQISRKLKDIKYTHPSTIADTIGGYSNNRTSTFITIMQCIELPEFIQIIRSIDEKCLISTIHMSDLDGFMTVQKQTC